jgi:rhodanese-related sulfurtransferase
VILVKVIDRDQLQDLMRSGAVVIEVLPEAEYSQEHITGAINLPLKQLDLDAVSELDRGSPIVVYCDSYT